MRGLAYGILSLAVVFSGRAAVKVELVASGFSRPLFATAPPADTHRLFVVEQRGRVRILDLTTKSIKTTPFLTVGNLLSGNEQGLLGLAFHPGYATNGYFYINQTVGGGGPAGHTEIARFQVQGDPAASDVADPSSKKLLLRFDQPESNHNGGWTAFGPDGYLYISTGDGGGGYDQHGGIGNGQNRMTYLGKLLRIDVDNGEPYSIPEGNPYRASLSLLNEIWAFGLRNPWRCSFDRETGDLWIGDVGQDQHEEIDVIPAGVGGLNFGWRAREGLIHTPSPVPSNEEPITPAVNPVYDYSHSVGQSVTGGYVYRGNAVPELRGKYLFGDYVTGRFWALTPDSSGTNGTTVEITAQINPAPKQIGGVSSFGEDATGELYICDLADGQIFRIVSADSPGITLAASRSNNGDLQISFNASANQAYILEGMQAFGYTSWTTVTNVPAETARSITLSTPVTGEQRYFRLRAL
jgi:glucose/arabinose dehydrogenase